MNDERPRYYTAIDLFWDILFVAFIAGGCYLGWKLGGNFLSLFYGGLVGRILWFVIVLVPISKAIKREGRMRAKQNAILAPQPNANLDEQTIKSLIQLLGEARSNISEECWHSGWSAGTEHYVPDLCQRAIATGVPQKWGAGFVTPVKAHGLVYIANKIGSWANSDLVADGFVPYQPFPIPEDVAADIDREQTKA